MTGETDDTPTPLPLPPIEGEGIAADAPGASFLPNDKDLFWAGFVQAFAALNVLAAMRYGRPLQALDVTQNPTARPASDTLCDIAAEAPWMIEWLAYLGPWVPRTMALGIFGLSTKMAFNLEVEQIAREYEAAAAKAANDDTAAGPVADGA